ncbi:MAG TPA: TIGR03086 family metal-binding protein [Humibacillus sp.]|nr:TIGR03086 family metal-binding protein [Humibacillus sp.]
MDTAVAGQPVGTQDVGELYRRSVQWWGEKLAAYTDDQWDLPTPCSQWSVRDLINHVVGEDRWTSPLMRGQTIAEVGDRFDGDLVGADPRAAGAEAAAEALSTVGETLPAHGTVHLSYGDESMDEYLRQLTADHLVHGWDLAVATGAESRLDPELVAAVAAWFDQTEDAYRSGGMIAARRSLTGDPQSDLLARFGRDGSWGPNHTALATFNQAFGRGDLYAIMGAMTQDCVFESTGPAPDGTRLEGYEAVRGAWQELFSHTRDPRFVEEDSFVAGDQATQRWRYEWTNDDGTPGHVRGVDVIRLRDGKVCEKFSYVKG